MQSLINIPDEMYSEIKKFDGKHDVFINRAILYEAICNGIVLDGLTNGEVIQKMFPEAEVKINGFIVDVIFEMFEFHVEESWWNSKWGE